MSRFAVIQRRNKRLDNTYRAVISARITPRLQEVSLRNVPMAEFGSFIVIEAEVNSRLYLEQVFGKVQIGRSVVNRIDPQDEQGINLAALNVRHQFLQRLQSVYRVCFRRLRVVNGLSDI